MKGRHLPTIDLERGHVGFDPGKIVQGAASRKTGEDVVHAKEQTTLGEIGQQAYEVVATPLNLDMLAFGEVVNADMHCGAAWHAAGDLFTQEEIWVTAQSLSGADGIVVGKGDQIHAFALENGVDFRRIVVRFTANALEQGNGAHPRMDGVDVKVAFHRLSQ
jgi:hypothetical protein